jgi:hypothetical protein
VQELSAMTFEPWVFAGVLACVLAIAVECAQGFYRDVAGIPMDSWDGFFGCHETL